jgi:hypothetical protein
MMLARDELFTLANCSKIYGPIRIGAISHVDNIEMAAIPYRVGKGSHIGRLIATRKVEV